jgi:hypothetical protein
MNTFNFVRLRLSILFVELAAFATPARAIKRTIGPPKDYRFQNASRICDGSDPKAFQFRTCSLMIDCVYENLTEAFKSSLSSGTSIAALLPTILALIGKPDAIPLYIFIYFMKCSQRFFPHVHVRLTSCTKVRHLSSSSNLLCYLLTVLLLHAASPSGYLAVCSASSVLFKHNCHITIQWHPE